MRQITIDAVEAFCDGVSFRKGNSEVKVYGRVVTMYLFGNVIARSVDGVIEVSTAGYLTNTTKERLNGLYHRVCGTSPIRQRRGVWFIYGQPLTPLQEEGEFFLLERDDRYAEY